MSRRILQEISLIILIVVSVSFNFGHLIHAQDDCKTLKECQALLEKYEKEIAQYEKNIAASQQKQRTLENKIYILRQKINKLELEIKRSNIIIKDLENQIGDTQFSIQKTSQSIEDSKEKLAEILREIYEQDQKSFLEILMSGNAISDFFENLIALENLSSKNQEILREIKKLKANLEEQKVSLDKEREEWERMMKIQILQKQESQRTKQEKEWLLKVTEGEEARYQKLLAESQEKAKKIRERIFELIGVPEVINFGQAYEIAKYVASITGVRPAFLLAVLKQESDIGRNVGQCYLKDPKTGAGIVVKTGAKIERVMKPGRDIPHFLKICKELKRDPYNTLVSCPMSFGWGGAMGPAQFIPSTWVLYKDKITAITGKPADPWNIKDAFLAAGLLLRDAGASRQTYDAEWKAAMIYFSGSTNPAYSFYGNSVMAIAKEYEQDIAQLEKFAKK